MCGTDPVSLARHTPVPLTLMAGFCKFLALKLTIFATFYDGCFMYARTHLMYFSGTRYTETLESPGHKVGI